MEVELDDRTLAHLQVVIGAKLRRKEGFYFSWTDDLAAGSGRSSVWLEPSVPIAFLYRSSERHVLNKKWLEELTVSANQPSGLTLLKEPGADWPPRVFSRV